MAVAEVVEYYSLKGGIVVIIAYKKIKQCCYKKTTSERFQPWLTKFYKDFWGVLDVWQYHNRDSTNAQLKSSWRLLFSRARYKLITAVHYVCPAYYEAQNWF